MESTKKDRSEYIFALPSKRKNILINLSMLPQYVIGWYLDRIRRIQNKTVAGWAIAEITCMSLSMATLFLIFITAILQISGNVIPNFINQYVIPLCLAASVGYLTNLIAVTMLFRPYNSNDDHPAGMIPFWRQGLIPKNKDILAEEAGKKVADHLLTPEAISDEIKILVKGVIQDENMQTALRINLGPTLRKCIPKIVDVITPELMEFFRKMATKLLSKNNIEQFFDNVIAPWLNSEDNKEKLVAKIIEILKDNVPFFQKKLKEVAEKYKEESWWKKLSLHFAEWTNGLDWDAIEEKLLEIIGSQETRNELIDIFDNIIEEAKQVLKDSDIDHIIETFKIRTSDYIAVSLEKNLEKELPKVARKRIADNRDFWRWLAKEGLPPVQTSIITWLEKEGASNIKKHFNVAGRVQDEVKKMDVVKVHEMINDVSAQHLGAIQVLGFGLGLIAGLLLLSR